MDGSGEANDVRPDNPFDHKYHRASRGSHLPDIDRASGHQASPTVVELLRQHRRTHAQRPGLEATVRRQQTEAAAALGAASTKRSDDGTAPTPNLASIADAVVAAAPDRQTHRLLRDSFVLWVDDHPENNSYERRALEAFGVRFAISTSTDDALDRLRRQTFDLIISDMSRPPDHQAGLTLLDALGYTNSPHELLSMVAQALTEVSSSRSNRYPVRRLGARARANS